MRTTCSCGDQMPKGATMCGLCQVDEGLFPQVKQVSGTSKMLVAKIKEKFKAGLQEKTGWGRNDVWSLFETCVSEAAVEVLDDKESEK
jgi:hypothetical protein